MSKKVTNKLKQTNTIPPLFLALTFLQCVVTIFVVLYIQTELNHATVMQKIANLKVAHAEVYCPNPELAKEKMVIDNGE